MTLPRPVLIALLGLALCAAAFLATRNANDTGGAVTSTPPVAQTPVTQPAQKATPKATKKAHPGTAHKATPADAKPAAPAKPAKPATTPAKPAPTSDAAKVLPAIKALGRGDVVIYFFTRHGAADDTGAREAVKSVRRDKGVSVFTVGFGDLEAFRPVLNGAGVSQVPSIVVVRGGRPGRLLEGYIDAATLRQTVADARR